MLKTKITRPLVLIILIFAVLALNGCQNYAIDNEQISNEEKIIIRFSHVVGEDTPKGMAAREFARLMKEKSNGKIEVQVFANGSLYRDGEEWDALQDGNIQMIAPAMSKMTSQIPELEIFDLPFLFNNLEQVHQLTDGQAGELIFEKAGKYNVEPLAIWDNGFKQFTNNIKQLHKPEDFKGLTFRIMPSNVLKEQFNILGANAEVRNFNDVYQSIINKEIDGQENTISNIYTKRFHEVQNYLTLSNHGYLGYLVIINQDFWNQLSPENRQLISATMQEVTEWQRLQAEEIHEKQLKAIKESKMIEIESLTEEEWFLFREKYSYLYKKFESRFDDTFSGEIKSLINN